MCRGSPQAGIIKMQQCSSNAHGTDGHMCLCCVVCPCCPQELLLGGDKGKLKGALAMDCQ